MRLIALVLLTMFSMGAAAEIDVQIAKDGKFDGGTIEVTGQEEQKDGGVKVTITVSPNSGYTIKKEAIEVYATYPPSGSRADTRDIEIASSLTLLYNGSEKEDVEDASKERNYTFTVPSGFGAWVKEAKFLPDGSKGGGDRSSLPFVVSTAEEKHLYWLESKGAKGFYMIAHTNNEQASTSNLPNPKMLWYFMDAGDGYYYIVNNATGRYLWLSRDLGTDNSIGLSIYDSNNDDKFKFSLDGSSGAWVFFPKEGGTSYWVNKQGGNTLYWNKNGKSVLKSSNYGGSPDVNSKWNIVAKDDVSWAHPFTDSTDDDKLFYLIQNAPSDYQSFYLSTDNNYASFSNESNNKRVWYFKEAPSDPNISIPNLKYYYIVNASTGNYLYFNSSKTDGTQYKSSANAVEIRDKTSTNEDEDRYQFAVVNAIGSGSDTYSIVPKSYIGSYEDRFVSLGVSGETTIDNNDHIGTVKDRAANSLGHWIIKPTTFSCGKPEISFDNSTNEVTMESETEDADIYYTTDGTTTPSSTNGTKYTGPFVLTEETTIKAIAIKDPMPNSPVETKTIYKVATPTIVYDEVTNSIKITSSTEEATIHYTTATTEGDLVEPTMATETTCSSGDELRDGVSNRYIKALAVKAGYITSDVSALFSATKLKCANPVVQRDNDDNYMLTCEYPAGVKVYYTTDNTDPNPTPSSEWTVGTSKSFAIGTTIKLMATAPDYNNSPIVTKKILDAFPSEAGGGTAGDPYRISTSELFDVFLDLVENDGQNGVYYQVTADLDISNSSTVSRAFKGHLDGGLFTLTGLDHPLFNSIDGGTVKNVILKDVRISKSGNVGAITGEAYGYTRIYNCGILPSNNKYENETSFVSSTSGYCGGLVGRLRDDSRVINCFNYANITGGSSVAGIVGYVDPVVDGKGSNTAVVDEKYKNLRTAVVNCMFYGNITSGTLKYPVYGGAKMLNNTDTGINNYDFYRSEANVGTLADYNCSWPAMEEYLTQYEFYRYLLNSNRELCGWWVGAPSAPRDMSTTDVQNVPKDASLMAKWVLDPSVAPYPILKPAGYYSSVINKSPRPDETNPQRIDPETRQWVSRASSTNIKMVNPKDAPETDGRSLGKISVKIKKNSSDSGTDKDIIITAMDFDNNDFCYGKIQLPYYNSIFGNPNSNDWDVRYGGNYKDKVVVGWEITSVTANPTDITNKSGTDAKGIAYDHTYSTDVVSGYNFTDRYCTTKDENRVFAQGGYYYVPYGVENIEITAKWATATYIDNTDHSYDRVYMSNKTENDLAKPSPGIHFAPAGYRPALGNGMSVSNASVNDVAGQISNTNGVYENAIVLVGNHQYRTGNKSITGKGCTIMSADLDFDNEPDNCLIWQLGHQTSRYGICPVRFDFLPVVEIGMAMKEDGSTQYYSLGCYRPLGHYEVTETSLIHFGQFEFGNKDRSTEAPLILNGGIFDQYTKGTLGKSDDNINYIIIGGNVRMPSFTPGAHPADREEAKKSTRHCPVNVMGGNIDYLYLSGNYNEKIVPNSDSPHCYIDGGVFMQIAAAGKEGIGGNVTFKINHSVIKEFYGGSTMDQADGTNYKIVKGNIEVTIDNSMVTKYCGGPKFGSMVSGKTVTTNATGTTFGVFYGGGNGGTSYVQYDSTDKTIDDATGTYNWSASDKGNLVSYTPGDYCIKDNKGIGYKADYEMEIVNSSAGTDAKKAIFRTYFYAAQFSATNTGPITNILENCKVLTNFYGGGNLGGVIGDVKSTLTDTQVEGNVFGAGYSASVPEVNIYEKTKEAPTINIYTGIITPTPEGSGSYTTYTWTNKTSIGGQTLDTDHPASPEVDGKRYYYTEIPLVNLGTVTGKATLTINGETTVVKKSVYGGGEESSVDGNTEVLVTDGAIGYEGAPVYADIVGNVYGGGRGLDTDVKAGLVTGNTKITIGATNGNATAPHIFHNIYGGGALGSVGNYDYNADGSIQKYNSGGNCEVKILSGKIGRDGDAAGHNNGMVNGASRGEVGVPDANGVDKYDHLAWVHDTHVMIGDAAKGTNSSGAGNSYDYPIIKGSVYGSGENGHTYQNTIVDVHSGTIGVEEIGVPDNQRFVARGNVYGSGCGTDTYTGTDGKTYYNLYAGIVLGTATVNIDGGHVVRNVYGAGSNGSVGTFTLNDNKKPTSCADGTGITYVNVSGGMIGNLGGKMNYPEDDGIGPDDFGHVFGAGRGELQDSTVYVNMALTGYVKDTHVTISNKAFITGSVYGGGECGHTLGDTYVTISGGQIGVGDEETAPYEDWTATSLKETAHWPYSETNSPYDRYSGDEGYNLASAKGGRKKATDGHTFNGNVFGGGSGYYPYAPGKWVRSAGLVEGNTNVTISGGHILSNVYGGNEMTDVYGSCTVTMTGGTVGVPRTWAEKRAHPVVGSLFGAGKGDKRVLFNTWTNVGSTSVTVSGGRVYGSVFGGGEDGHVLGDATTTIKETDAEHNPTIIGTLGTTGYDGHVFGGGRGSYTALTAGVVCGNTTVNIEGGTMLGSVYGGGRLASVGTHLVPPTATGSDQTEHKYYGKEISDGKKQIIWKYVDESTSNDDDDDQPGLTHGHITVNVKGGVIGAVDNNGKLLNSQFSIGDVFGGCKGTTNGEYSNNDNNPVANAQTRLGISKSALVNMLGGTVYGSIYGGGEVGNVGEIGNVDSPALAFAKINLLGGTVNNVFGGGLGMKDGTNGATENVPALVKGDVKVNLNGLEEGDYEASLHSAKVGDERADHSRLATAGCIVTGTIFGCNNLNGTPTGHARVHVFKTIARPGQADEGVDKVNSYDVAAVYGGGNQADYIPSDTETQQKSEVIVEGCDLSSIYQVYGGGNAAATPGTVVLIKGTKNDENAYGIYEVFGGGNGVSTADFNNPGANVGYRTQKTESGEYVNYGGEQGGKALVQLMAGKITNAYGGSNTKGDIRGGSNVETVNNDGGAGCCESLLIDHMFGGGKNAGMKSGASIILGCSNSNSWVKEIYAGAENADVEGDVSLTITSGKFGRVFGGNKESGRLEGSITVNIEESGKCGIPVIIGELYGGGNQAPYSVYGYNSDGSPKTEGTNAKNPPVVNIKAFTSIGNVYGGGYGERARMYGSPTVNINEVEITHTDNDDTYDGNAYSGETIYFKNGILDPTITEDPQDMTGIEKVVIPAHVDKKMGAILNVFGGGNAATVYGNTQVNIGTTATETLVELNDGGEPQYNTDGSPVTDSHEVKGADIRGNVYGGGNKADVTGSTNVVVGKQATN